MSKFWILVLFVGFTFSSKAQSFTGNDSLQAKVVFYIPTMTSSQLNSIKVEFAKYPQILKATFIYGNHNALLVELNMGLNNPSFVYYGELIKPMCASIDPADIKIKTPIAYDEILNLNDNASSFIIK